VKGGVEEKEQEEGSLVVEEQFALAGAVAGFANLAQPRQQETELLKAQQPRKVLSGHRSFGHRCRGATSVNLLSEWPLQPAERIAAD
jgi:hypothetical protein